MPEGSQKRKATRVRSLRQRWIVNSVVPIFVLLALIVGGVSLGISNYYYKGMLDGLERQARAQSGAFVDYFMDQGFANYLQRANQAISDYADKERVEMQFLSSVGRIQASSTSNLTVGTRPGTEDISRAVETNRISYFRGADPKTGEQILAVSHPLTVNGKVVGVLRFVTSLRQVNVQVWMTVLAVVLVALLCLLLVLSSNLIFINNVVEPVAVVSDAAKRISQGSYGFTLENKYTGELGELVDNINDMSMKIGQNEKMKTEFISSVSHELRTPLTAISGWGETLLADRERDQIQLHRGLRIILNESRRLSTMVEELLEFSKMEDGRFTLQLEEMDLQAEFEDAIFTYRELFRQEGIELRYEPGPGTTEAGVLQRTGQRRQARRRRPAHRCLSDQRGNQSGGPGPGLRSRRSGGRIALCEAEILQGLLQGPGQRHRSGCVRRDRAAPRRHLRHCQCRGRRCSGDHLHPGKRINRTNV